MERDILTIEEVSEYLQLSRRSIYKLIHEHKIPNKKVLNKYRFEKATLREWVRGNKEE